MARLMLFRRAVYTSIFVAVLQMVYWFPSAAARQAAGGPQPLRGGRNRKRAAHSARKSRAPGGAHGHLQDLLASRRQPRGGHLHRAHPLQGRRGRLEAYRQHTRGLLSARLCPREQGQLLQAPASLRCLEAGALRVRRQVGHLLASGCAPKCQRLRKRLTGDLHGRALGSHGRLRGRGRRRQGDVDPQRPLLSVVVLLRVRHQSRAHRTSWPGRRR